MGIEIIAELISLVASLSIIGVNILYGVIAPWWRSITGLSFMAVLTAFSFLIVAQLSQSFFEGIVLYIIEIFIGLFILGAMTWVGAVMVKAQLRNKNTRYAKHSPRSKRSSKR